MLNIFKKNEEVKNEGAVEAVVETATEGGKKFDWKKTVVGGTILAAGAAVCGLLLNAIFNKDEAELCVPDTDEPIEVTDEMIEEVTGQ